MDAILEETGIAHCYGFIEGKLPSLPYIVYNYPQVEVTASDNASCPRRVYTVTVSLELLTRNKDFAAEDCVDKCVPAGFTKTERLITSENLYSVSYEFTYTFVQKSIK